MSQMKCRHCGGHVGPKADECPHCGQSNPTNTKLLLWSVLLILTLSVLFLLMFPKGSIIPQRTNASQAVQSSETVFPANCVILRKLRASYPDLRERNLCWKDLSGLCTLAVPDKFWHRLTPDDRLRLVDELDTFFETHNWRILTGLYDPVGSVKPAIVRPRAELLKGY